MLPNDFKPFVLSIFEWPLKAGFTVSVFRVIDLKILCKVGTQIFFFLFFLEINIIFGILKGKFIFFPENLKKILAFTSKFRLGRVTLNTGIFLFGLIQTRVPVLSSVSFLARTYSTVLAADQSHFL